MRHTFNNLSHQDATRQDRPILDDRHKSHPDATRPDIPTTKWCRPAPPGHRWSNRTRLDPNNNCYVTNSIILNGVVWEKQLFSIIWEKQFQHSSKGHLRPTIRTKEKFLPIMTAWLNESITITSWRTSRWHFPRDRDPEMNENNNIISL